MNNNAPVKQTTPIVITRALVYLFTNSSCISCHTLAGLVDRKKIFRDGGALSVAVGNRSHGCKLLTESRRIIYALKDLQTNFCPFQLMKILPPTI